MQITDVTPGRMVAPRVGGHEYETLETIDHHTDVTSGGMMAPRVGGQEYETLEAIIFILITDVGSGGMMAPRVGGQEYETLGGNRFAYQLPTYYVR